MNIHESSPTTLQKKLFAFAGPDLRNGMQIIQYKIKKTRLAQTIAQCSNHSPSSSCGMLYNYLQFGVFKPQLLGNHTVYKK